MAGGVVCFVVDGVLVILSLIVWGVTVTGTTGVIEVSSVIRVAEYGAPDSESIEMSPGRNIARLILGVYVIEVSLLENDLFILLGTFLNGPDIVMIGSAVRFDLE